MLARRGSADSAAKPRVWPGRSAAGRSSLCVQSV